MGRKRNPGVSIAKVCLLNLWVLDFFKLNFLRANQGPVDRDERLEF